MWEHHHDGRRFVATLGATYECVPVGEVKPFANCLDELAPEGHDVQLPVYDVYHTVWQDPNHLREGDSILRNVTWRGALKLLNPAAQVF